MACYYIMNTFLASLLLGYLWESKITSSQYVNRSWNFSQLLFTAHDDLLMATRMFQDRYQLFRVPSIWALSDRSIVKNYSLLGDAFLLCINHAKIVVDFILVKHFARFPSDPSDVSIHRSSFQLVFTDSCIGLCRN